MCFLSLYEVAPGRAPESGDSASGGFTCGAIYDEDGEILILQVAAYSNPITDNTC